MLEIKDLNGRIIDSTTQDKTEVTLNLEKINVRNVFIENYNRCRNQCSEDC